VPVKTWPVAGGQTASLYADGWMSATRKNGTVKFWKPKRPVVLTDKSDFRTVIRAQARTAKMLAKAAKAAGYTRPTKRAVGKAKRK